MGEGNWSPWASTIVRMWPAGPGAHLQHVLVTIHTMVPRWSAGGTGGIRQGFGGAKGGQFRIQDPPHLFHGLWALIIRKP